MLGVTKDVISGMSEDEAKSTLTNDRPIIVFVYDADVDEQRFLVEEQKAFFDDKVAVGARFFDCVRIDLESAKTDRALAKAVKRAPALVFLRPDYSVHKTITAKKFNAGKIFAAMCSTTMKDYKTCVMRAISTQKKLTKERSKLDKEWVKLERINTQIDDERSQRKRARLIKERDALQKKLGDIEVKLDERESALYKLEKKASKREACAPEEYSVAI